jgi:hypothetical protein
MTFGDDAMISLTDDETTAIINQRGRMAQGGTLPLVHRPKALTPRSRSAPTGPKYLPRPVDECERNRTPNVTPRLPKEEQPRTL